jgi:hypothetical protein
MKSLQLFVFALAALVAVPVLGQDKPASNMEILRQKIRADKKLLVAANMDLTESEAKAFWPIYDEYQKDLQGINERLGQAIQSYADAYNKKTLTDQQAKQLLDEALAIQQAEVNLRKTYADKLAQVLPARVVARYIQIENKIRAAINYELAEAIPLVP